MEDRDFARIASALKAPLLDSPRHIQIYPVPPESEQIYAREFDPFHPMNSRVKLRHIYLSIVILGASTPSARATILPAPIVIDGSPAFSPAFAATNALDNTESEFASAGQGLDFF